MGAAIGVFKLGADGNLVPKVVEIDESNFVKCKYNKGQVCRQNWVFGGVERELFFSSGSKQNQGNSARGNSQIHFTRD